MNCLSGVVFGIGWWGWVMYNTVLPLVVLALLAVPIALLYTPYECVTVLVIGGGPIGLLYAIEAIQQGACTVTLVEKRIQYSRKVWFDLYSNPWYPSLDILHQYNFSNHTAAPFINTNFSNILSAVTIQAKTLEHFLYNVAISKGVKVLRGYQFQSVHFSGRHYKASLLKLDDSSVVNLPFKLLVGADGSKSKVRDQFNITFEPQQSFKVSHLNRTIIVENIHQVSIIVDFKLQPGGVCPKERKHDLQTGEKLHPWFASLRIPGVSSVFKRFYFDHCQMQILVDRSVGDELLSTSKFIPATAWDIILSVSNLYLEHQFSSVSALQRAIEDDGVVIHPIKIYAADSTTKVLNNGDSWGVVVITGDASFTAHYRLGIGINTGFALLKPFGIMVRSLVNESQPTLAVINEAAHSRERSYRERLKQVIDLQLSTMFFGKNACCMFISLLFHFRNLLRFVCVLQHECPGHLVCSTLLQKGTR
jgi:2-polyprenyl-6-methoxyphenol hydroxylase-like FAD-dependent oxidoreductase